RRWDLGGGQSLLLSDTVGFIRDLPHHLVASFRATLEEVIHSDLLLHVVDAASYDAVGQVDAVEQVLDELGCGEVSTITVLNKIDALEDDSAAHLLRIRLPEAVEVSALRGEGLERLTDRVLQQMRGRYVTLTLDSDAANGKLQAYVRKHGYVLGQACCDGRVRLEVRLPSPEVQRVIALGGTVVQQT
ncbi:MAG: GTPase HflX, partial [Dehalococcoidia bacterium]